MKVCTDACLFGAWIAERVSGYRSPISGCLDIGSGTGLLSLMFAQKNPTAIIDAVEIDKAAASQAKENFDASSWKKRLHIYDMSIQQFNLSTHQLYDLIISNPPFYQHNLKSSDAQRNLALHSMELSPEDLLHAADKHLKQDGTFAALMPYNLSEQFIHAAMQQSFWLQERVNVKQTPGHNYFRTMLLFGRNKTEPVNSTIAIMNEQNKYTPEFTALLKDYYLYL